MKRLFILRNSPAVFLTTLALLVTTYSPRAEDTPEVITPTGKPIDLIEGIAKPDRHKQFTVSLNQDIEPLGDPNEIWTVDENGIMRISGEGWGYIRTNKPYRDYHLVVEYTWGEKTWAPRLDCAKDCGILVHGHGKDGAFRGTWIASVESQLIEGGSGDILILSAKDQDGNVTQSSLTLEYSLDRDGEKIWTPAARKQVVTAGRINWLNRDPDWEDKIGYRGKNEIENVPGEWNRMEVICRGSNVDIYLNGKKINSGSDAKPDSGYICIQTECAEVFVRRYEIWPLDTFKEEWSDEDKAP